MEEVKLTRKQLKKQEVAAHNASFEISQNVLPIGYCGKCGKDGPLIMYLKSEDDNIFNYYCLGADCGHKASLVDLDLNDTLFFPVKDILRMLELKYGEDKVKDLWTKRVKESDDAKAKAEESRSTETKIE